MKIRVYYEDTDLGGVVYHTNYIKYCERARSEIFFQKGLSPHKNNSFFVVKNLQANFKLPAKFGDMLEVSTTLVKIKKASIILSQTIQNQNNQEIFDISLTLAFVKDGKPVKIPNDMVLFFKNI